MIIVQPIFLVLPLELVADESFSFLLKKGSFSLPLVCKVVAPAGFSESGSLGRKKNG